MVHFDHSKSTFEQSLGISPERADVLTATLFYEMINHAYLSDRLFDNMDEAPRNMVTKTGILEKAFEDAVDEKERIFCTWEYSKIDTLSEDKKNPLFGMTMLFQFCKSDKDKFIEKYIEFKSEAMKNMGLDNEEED